MTKSENHAVVGALASLIVSVVSVVFAWRASHSFNALVTEHLGSHTYMVPLLAPLRIRLVFCETASVFALVCARQSLRYAPRWLAYCAICLSIGAIITTAWLSP